MKSYEAIVPAGHETIYDQWHLAPAVRMGDQIICSGVIGTTPEGSIPEDLAEEVAQAFANLRDVLAAAGATLEQVADVLTFHVDLATGSPVFMGVRDQWLSAPWPAWTAIGVSQVGGGLPGARIEIRATAWAPRA